MDTEDGEDRLSSLPEGLLEDILFYLPSRDAVRTSVLARRWRTVWKSVRALRVMESESYQSANELNGFVNNMLLLRETLPLNVVEIKSYHESFDEDHNFESLRYIEHWVRYAFLREVKALRLYIMDVDVMLPDKLLTSSKLEKLELTRVVSEGPTLDFSSCPLLNDLKMEFCNLLVDKITSPSIAHLSVTYCCFKSVGRTRISTPNLVSLQLVDCRERTPLLESMPKPVSAFVRLCNRSDCCDKSYEIGDCGDNSCKGCPGSTGNSPSILLQGLSCAANLELTAKKTVFVFRRDLTRCPIFSKLKTLLLNGWCLTRNFDALVCFLQHSPALEKLILQLPEVRICCVMIYLLELSFNGVF
ncbi:hypothetical protein PR202_gb16268 [Eleusine coracana subsp. coracana]|uniref:F-box domain-containing protein n=1 Tax=Eleusine coracana subsp. coracana TaxID=191504 RepID=A0AAV5EZY3_ELECO|nr:hypothetical protein PR202_gb16268 [Eleusine coracana subsp. coracana]